MADIYVKMVGEDDSPDKCREARRRRIEMRRFTVVAGDSPSRAGSLSRSAERKREAEAEADAAESDPATGRGEKRSRPARDDSLTPPPPPPSSATPSSPSTPTSPGEASGAPAIASCSASSPAPAVEPRLAFGSISLSGRSREMEDAVSVQPGFFLPPGGGSMLHFFAVFDGHGGSHVSALCKERMHVILAEELAAAGVAEATDEDRWRAAMARSFERMDELALTACVCGNVGYPPCRCERSGIESDIVGSTAVVALVSRDRLLVANCGDSRAVLSRAGRAFPLSSDHKPDRPDELARIEAAGGRVIYLNGARVHGILAMSRALGDRYLKPAVISEPEVRIVQRSAEDECLIIASDGLWDVLPNDLACDVARRCLEEADTAKGTEDLGTGAAEGATGVQEEQQASEEHCSAAAALLARLALGRKSADNISVIVIDLRRS
uniref:protein-serine/threonine phosphatase n=1 Tax=Elaeis guineensis var. tenera TaxID=51953 RepID=A0A6I9S479_ELAGV|nr:probable protein phosphatase 2C 75 isoform X1 [Elaeis guineensis]XP_019709343.1 probable protein phosphatase 2C 75 isoform X1 [Elaeis guineensis]XP_029123002.1 probable protein phosphatase 2C 75 isoform X1 [Elaeis guineensis]